jgi:hypothetical protein
MMGSMMGSRSVTDIGSTGVTGPAVDRDSMQPTVLISHPAAVHTTEAAAADGRQATIVRQGKQHTANGPLPLT